MTEYLHIGQVAETTGLSIKAIRYYEAAGVLRPPARSESGYRLYGQQDIRRLYLLKSAKRLGFTLREAGDLLSLADLGCCTIVRPGLRALLYEKLHEIDALMQDLRALRAQLIEYAQGLPVRTERDVASCTPESCVPAVEAPITLLLRSVPGTTRVSASRGGVKRKG